MSDDDRPQLDLGKPPGRLAKKPAAAGRGLLILVLLLQAALLALFIFRPSAVTAPLAAGGGEELRAAALDLEERGLSLEAAGLWEEYAGTLEPGSERARVFYRSGNLCFKAREFGRAAVAFVRTERDPGCGGELKKRIGPKMVECLRNLGFYGEVSRELARRTMPDGGGDEPSPVLATFAGESFAEADLERMIRFRVERMMGSRAALQGGGAREAIMEQMADPKIRQQMFGEFLRTELMSRRARELGLDKSGEFLDLLSMTEQELLASLFLEQELGSIASTFVDVEAYFNAHREEYRDPEEDRVPELEEVKERVTADYLSQKQKELVERLMGDLMARYDVKIIEEEPETP